MKETYKILILLMFIAAFLASSCSTNKFVQQGGYVLKNNKIQCDDKSFNTSALSPYIQQHPNSKWFSMFKIPLGIYSLSGKDSTKWLNRVVRRLGEAPVVHDSTKAELSCTNMTNALKSMGYMDAGVSLSTYKKRRKISVNYDIHLGNIYTIDSVKYDIADDNVRKFLSDTGELTAGLKKGDALSLSNLDTERKRLSTILSNNGYYKFNKEFIRYVADSLDKKGRVGLTLKVLKYRASNNSSEENHKQYHIGRITYSSTDGREIALRQHALTSNTTIKTGDIYRAKDVQATYNNFSRLQSVKFINMHFVEIPDSSKLNIDMQINMNKPNTISFQPEGTNTNGDLGAAAALIYENNNVFRGGELFSFQIRGAFEAIKGLEGYQNQNYIEYNAEAKLAFPRMLIPFRKQSRRYANNSKSELLLSYNMQNRPEFHRVVLTSAWRYYWRKKRNTSFRFDLIDLDFVQMPWISSTFKKEYLDDASNRNAILRYNYENLFILKTGLNISYGYHNRAFRSNIEFGGNLLNAISHITKSTRNENGQYTMFNIAYAQYFKGDFDYTHFFNFDNKNSLYLHFGFGIAVPYGNSDVLPFEKRYFSGGANSVRGWNVRELGPGKFKGTGGSIDFINQTGDMKIDMNVEMRTLLFWKINGAVFIDAGNIWTIKNYKEQPGGQFKFGEFYKQLAVSYGLGLRVNFDYFIVRLDFGMKAISPAYTNKKEHFPMLYPNVNRDLAIHFAVGMPF